MTTIITKHEPTGASDTPTVLQHGELAVNAAAGKLWVGDQSTNPILLANQGGTTSDVNQAAHGFQPLDCITYNAGAWEKAQANDVNNVALGVVIAVSDVDNFSYALSGRFELTHGLSTDEWYYLSESVAGGLTDVEPAGISQPIVYTDDANHISVYPYRPALSATGQLALPPGLAEGETLRWDDTAGQWVRNDSLVVDAAGRVGIGTDSPVQLLTVHSATGTAGAELLSPDGNAFLRIISGDTVSGLSTINFGDSDTNTAGQIQYQHATDDLRFNTSATEKMRITSAGNVGIGTTSPNAKLDVDGGAIFARDAVNAVTFQRDAVTVGDIGGSSGGAGFFMRGSAGKYIAFSPNGAEAARLDTSGNLLVGRTTNIGSSRFTSQSSVQAGIFYRTTAVDAGIVEFYSDNGGAQSLKSYIRATDGDLFLVSDARKKKNVKGIQYGLEEIVTLRPVSFEWVGDDGGKSNIGFIAQEVEGVVPECVTHNAETDDYMMSKDALIPVLVKAIQELSASVTELTARVEALEP